MLEIYPVQVHRSFGGVAAGTLAVHLLGTTSYYERGLVDRAANIQTFQASSNTGTLGAHTFALMTDAEPQEPLVSFFANLLSVQERLGEEFEQVLYDNLWELYAR